LPARFVLGRLSSANFLERMRPIFVHRYFPSHLACINNTNSTCLVARPDVAPFGGANTSSAAGCQSRSRKSAQDDKWNFCLTAGTL
jgi:hypothetical protein